VSLIIAAADLMSWSLIAVLTHRTAGSVEWFPLPRCGVW